MCELCATYCGNIDGWHDTFSARSCNVPDIFPNFKGSICQSYQSIESENMRISMEWNSEVCRQTCSQYCLIHSGEGLPGPCSIKVHVELYLLKAWLIMLTILPRKTYAACVPSHQVEENYSISFIPVSASRPSQLDAINQALAMSSELDIIELSTFSPTDPRQKYGIFRNYLKASVF